jgi:hypothetical protein
MGPGRCLSPLQTLIKCRPLDVSRLLFCVFTQHGGAEGLGEGQEEANTQGEVVRQKEYLERTLVSLKNQLSQGRESCEPSHPLASHSIPPANKNAVNFIFAKQSFGTSNRIQIQVGLSAVESGITGKVTFARY